MSGGGYCIVDPDGTIAEVDAGFARLFGGPDPEWQRPGRWVGVPIRERFPAIDHPPPGFEHWGPAYYRAMAGEPQVWRVDPLSLPSGETYSSLWRNHPRPGGGILIVTADGVDVAAALGRS